jgi:hypothetical protein
MDHIFVYCCFAIGCLIGYLIFVKINRMIFGYFYPMTKPECMFHHWEKIGVWSKGEFNYKPILRCKVCDKRAPNDD